MCIGPAFAGTVRVSGSTLRYVAATGEANDLTIVMSSDRTTWTVTENGAPLTIGAGCGPGSDVQTASCTVPAPNGDAAVNLALGDEADRAHLPDGCHTDPGSVECTTIVGGGPGNDTLIAYEQRNGSGDGRINGGTGNDWLSGRGELIGGPGADVLEGDDARLEGGLGADTLRTSGEYYVIDDFAVAVYAGRGRPVTVTLDGRRNDGAPNENDLVLVPNVVGGSADDLLVGDDGHNVLTGGPGDDILRGKRHYDYLRGDSAACDVTDRAPGGADRIYGGGEGDVLWGCGGRDILRAGWGNDRLNGAGGSDFVIGGRDRDSVSGGFGSDRIVGGTELDTLRGMSGDDAFDARDGDYDRVRGGRGRDRARIDRGIDKTHSIERAF